MQISAEVSRFLQGNPPYMSEQFEYKTNGKGILAKYRKKVDKSCKAKEKEACNSSFSFLITFILEGCFAEFYDIPMGTIRVLF